jgi:hypothetical protein
MICMLPSVRLLCGERLPRLPTLYEILYRQANSGKNRTRKTVRDSSFQGSRPDSSGARSRDWKHTSSASKD